MGMAGLAESALGLSPSSVEGVCSTFGLPGQEVSCLPTVGQLQCFPVPLPKPLSCDTKLRDYRWVLCEERGKGLRSPC